MRLIPSGPSHLNGRLAIVLALAAFSIGAAAPAAPAATPTAALVQTGVVRQARLGRGFGTRGYPSYRRSPYSYRRAPYGYRRPGHPFLRGLFFGWLLSHFFGGGFPLFPFVLLGLAFFMLRRSRRHRYY